MAKTILIIEDDNDIRDMMTYILRDEGYEVVASPEDLSRSRVLELAPALILLDDRLTAGFGRDLCRQLKNDPATRRIPVALVSAIKGLQQVAETCGADACLPKPFDLEELVALARRFCGSNR